MWRNVWRPLTFTLVIDYFGVKFEGDTHANHLVKTLKTYYNVTVDWKGELYVGIKLKWEYKKQTLDTHIPNFVPKPLKNYQHQKPSNPQHAPAKVAHVQYRAKIQTTEDNNSPHISAVRIKRIQDVVGKFAWYSRTTYPTMAATMSSIASHQSKSTEKLEEELKYF